MQLRERLRRFALAIRDDATRCGTLPFPGHVTVLAGPLHCLHPRLSAPARSGPQQHGGAGAGQADDSDLP